MWRWVGGRYITRIETVWNNLRELASLAHLCILVRIVRAAYSSLSVATHTGTTLCASTSCTPTRPHSLLASRLPPPSPPRSFSFSARLAQTASRQCLPMRSGEKSVTRRDAWEDRQKAGMVCSATPWDWMSQHGMGRRQMNQIPPTWDAMDGYQDDEVSVSRQCPGLTLAVQRTISHAVCAVGMDGSRGRIF